MPSLFVIQGRDQGSRFELGPPPQTFTLGRDPGNAVQLHDTEVSRRHAELLFTGDQMVLTDLGSSNGTYVNHQRIERQELASGDQIQIGRSVLLFTAGGDSFLRDAGQRVSIVEQNASREEPSRIVRTMAETEGSALFDLEIDPTQSNWLAQARSNLQIMYRTALAVSRTLDIDRLLDRIMQLIFEWVEADRGCVMLWDAASEKLVPHVRRDRRPRKKSVPPPSHALPGEPPAPPEDTLAISQTILDYVLQRKEGVITSDARDDARWDGAESIVSLGVREAICVPMLGRYGLQGVIYIDTHTPAAAALTQGRKFGEDHLKLMVAIGHQAALAVEDTNYYAAMVRSERLAAMGQTIALLSHHIKNILQGIRGGSYLIEMGLKEHDEPLISKGWGIVERNQKRISNMVLDMLTFSKEREPELAPAYLNRTVAEVIELMQVHAAEKQIQISWQPDTQLPQMVFDEEGLHRAVLNVLTNAIDAVEDRLAAAAEIVGQAGGNASTIDATPGRIVVRTLWLRDEQLARVCIQDNGTGIEPAKIGEIFQMFVSSKGGRGTGLGLSVSQKILQEHGGQIRVQSQLGSGTEFQLELPVQLPEEKASPTVQQ
ncbi:MAG: ATP-binding protein [Pirellulales bacterium]|nr:ATP-binding protein [Pirellulales bacterium]